MHPAIIVESMDEGRKALALSVGAIVVFAIGVGAYQVWSDQDWIVWTGIATSAALALVGLTRSLRLVRSRVEHRGVPVVALVLSTAILVFEIGLVVIVLALSYALRDLTF
jgi:hypothetical protein